MVPLRPLVVQSKFTKLYTCEDRALGEWNIGLAYINSQSPEDQYVYKSTSIPESTESPNILVAKYN